MRALEEIYAEPKVLLHFVHNHQVRMFARTVDDPPMYHWWLDIDDERMAIAKANLARTDVLGLTEHFDEGVRAPAAVGLDHRAGGATGFPDPLIHAATRLRTAVTHPTGRFRVHAAGEPLRRWTARTVGVDRSRTG